jgi:hypothetical protein
MYNIALVFHKIPAILDIGTNQGIFWGEDQFSHGRGTLWKEHE